MRKTWVLLGLMLTLSLMPAGTAQARLWVAGQAGANFTTDTDIWVHEPEEGVTDRYYEIKTQPSVLAGLTVGYDFVKEGFLGANYPYWLKYFSFAIDWTYNNLNFKPKDAVWVSKDDGVVSFGGLRGFVNTVSFLFMFRYGFFADSEVAFGRLQPYLAVGPGIMVVNLRGGGGSGFEDFNFGSKTGVTVALVTEAGCRYMALKNVSLDVGFRYRYARPDNYGWQEVERRKQEIENHNIKFTLDQLTAIFRVGYHF